MNVISLGVGVQSSAIALMAMKGEIRPRPDLIVFSDPGWETKATYQYARWLKRTLETGGMKVIYTNNGNIKNDLLKAAKWGTRVASLPYFTLSAEGDTGIVMRQCTSEYKINGVRKAIKQYRGFKTSRGFADKEIKLWMGISTDEIQRVKPSQERWIENIYPLIDKGMSRMDCMSWLERNGYPVPPKSSCIGCPFHSDRTWLEMKRHDPESWKDAVEVDKAIRKMPKIKGQVFLHRSCKPLDQVELNENQLEFDFDGFGNECEGFCGV